MSLIQIQRIAIPGGPGPMPNGITRHLGQMRRVGNFDFLAELRSQPRQFLIGRATMLIGHLGAPLNSLNSSFDNAVGD